MAAQMEIFLNQLLCFLSYLKCEILKIVLIITSLLETEVVPIAMKYIVKGYFPDFMLRFAIRLFLKMRLLQCGAGGIEEQEKMKQTLIKELKNSEIALNTEEANDQHYEVPTEFYTQLLGPWLKYSCNYWSSDTLILRDSEELMMNMICERAQIEDGMKILDLGCGWGSFSLYAAKKFPNCKITSVSNSVSQKEFIMKKAEELGIDRNVNVITCDANKLDEKILGARKTEDLQYDRIVSIEMMEHMKNYELLLKKLSEFLSEDGKLFIHMFCHKTYLYHFTDGWMASTFFTGGTMVSENTLLYFQDDFTLQEKWAVNGVHYQKTLDKWLEQLDEAWKHGRVQQVLKKTYGDGQEDIWYTNWRLFHLACSELFRYNNGNEWFVSHYLFQKRNIIV